MWSLSPRWGTATGPMRINEPFLAFTPFGIS
jgi:hypothetical protein